MLSLLWTVDRPAVPLIWNFNRHDGDNAKLVAVMQPKDTKASWMVACRQARKRSLRS